jgi:hypothetical protein
VPHGQCAYEERTYGPELSQGMIKTICYAISRAFYSWELKEDDDNDSNGKITLDPYAEKTT